MTGDCPDAFLHRYRCLKARKKEKATTSRRADEEGGARVLCLGAHVSETRDDSLIQYP